MIDVERLRADTPGTRTVTHFNNAGAALMPIQVIDAVKEYLDAEARYGGYETHAARADDITAAYAAVASLIGCDRSELAMAPNATRAWDMAFYSLGLGEGDRVLTTTSEYVSNWAAYLQMREEAGVVVEVVEDSPCGDIDIEALEAAVDAGPVAVISLNHMPTNSGLVNPAAEVGKVANAHGIPYLLDACQSVGHIPIDVGEIGCDMLTATSRKYVRGPRGAGFLYVREGFIDRLAPVFVETESASIVTEERYELLPTARRFETWEKSYATIVGLGRAAAYADEVGVDAIWERIDELASDMRDLLADVDGVEVQDIGCVLSGIVTFTVDGRQTIEVDELLHERGINVSTSSRSSAPVDMARRDLDSVVRASVHAYNTLEEIETLIEAIDVIA